MIEKENCCFAGKIIKLYGAKGELLVKTNGDLLKKNKTEPIFVDIDGGLVPFFIAENGLHPQNHSTVKILFRDIHAKEQAQRLLACEIYMSTQNLQNHASEEPHESDSLNSLEGFSYVDEKRGNLGRINKVQNFSGNLVLSIHINSKELLIPFATQNLIELDRKKQSITMKTPTGLLDLYLK